MSWPKHPFDLVAPDSGETPEEQDRIGEILSAVEVILTLLSVFASFSILALIFAGAILYNVIG